MGKLRVLSGREVCAVFSKLGCASRYGNAEIIPRVRTTIERALDDGLPDAYTPDLYRAKCDAVYQHVYDAYAGPGQSIYGPAA